MAPIFEGGDGGEEDEDALVEWFQCCVLDRKT